MKNKVENTSDASQGAFAKLAAKYGFWAILAVAIADRFFNITKSSIWHDEGYTALMVKQGIGQITYTTAIDVHPPLFYYFLHYWSLIFGNSELALRSMSAMFGIGVVVGVYLLAKKLFGKNVGLIAMLFAALAPYLIRYSQEARMYGVEGFWTIFATYFLILALEKKTSDISHSGSSGIFQKVKSWISQNDFKYWILYVIFMTSAIYTHYYAFFLVFVHWIYIFSKSFGTKERPILSKKWWISNIAIALLFLPWVPNVIKQFTKIQGNYWIPPVNLRTIPDTLIGAFTYSVPNYPSYIYVLSLVLFVGITGYLAFRIKDKSKEVLLLAMYAIVPSLIVFALSLKQPVYQTRYFVFAMPALFILFAVLINGFKNKYFKIALIVLISLVFINGTRVVYEGASHQMKDVVSIVNEDFKKGDGLVATELYVYLDFDYYNNTGQRAKLIDAGEIRNNNEFAFIYPFRNELVRKDWNSVESKTGIVWVIGKTNPKSYEKIPLNWNLVLDEKRGYTEVRKYLVD